MPVFKYIYLFALVTFVACESKPKVIVADVASATGSEPANMQMPADPSVPTTASATNADVHQVVANEVMQAERYTYLKVSEAGKSFWIATAKTEAQKGQTYLYRGGLMKTNFESIEFKRTFDTIYLVSSIISASQHPGGSLSGGAALPSANTGATQDTKEVPVVKDAVKLSDLIANKEKYAGKVVTISGECVKVNNGIMGKNWVHIQDGSKKNGKALDLTVTTNMNVGIGNKVALKGKIAINKDFGAGYKYDIIMEEASGL